MWAKAKNTDTITATYRITIQYRYGTERRSFVYDEAPDRTATSIADALYALSTHVGGVDVNIIHIDVIADDRG